MRVLFLDMDGVVNSAKYFKAGSHTKYRQERGRRKQELRDAKALHAMDPAAAAREQMWQVYLQLVDPAAVASLNEVVARTGCKVVMSSSWRWSWEMEELTEFLASAGAEFVVHDRTPNCYVMPVGVTEHQRGYEIDAWLQAHPEVEAYAILDDADDMAHLLPRLVQTTWGEGLLPEHVEPLVALLQKPIKE